MLLQRPIIPHCVSVKCTDNTDHTDNIFFHLNVDSKALFKEVCTKIL